MSGSEEKIIFQEKFDGELDADWVWLRENPDCWRMGDGGLEIAVEPGVAATVHNALVRPAPDRSSGIYAIEVTIFNYTVPTQQYEQAGITWYQNGEPVFKEVKELVHGEVPYHSRRQADAYSECAAAPCGRFRVMGGTVPSTGGVRIFDGRNRRTAAG